MRSLDLFTGYGGLTLALEPWCKPIAYVEIEEYAQKIISYRMADRSLPRAPILADVKNVKGKPGDCDIIVGGFPCQDISIAGSGVGLGGERSGLYFEIHRLAKEIQPSFIFLENVPAIRTRGLDVVARSLAEIGYDCRWTMLSASDVGAPHKRERWFMLAHSNGHDLWEQSRGSEGANRKKKILPRATCKNGDIAYASSEGLEGLHGQKSRNLQLAKLHEQKWLKVKPTICGGDYGTSCGLDRIKALGNGVVPQQARVAFEYLLYGCCNV